MRYTALYRLKIGALAAFLTLLIPSLTLAQTTGGGSNVTLETYITTALGFINRYLIPLIFGIATLMFLWGIANLFLVKSASDEARENGKRLALWGILTFVFIISIWGLVNMLITGFNIGENKPICPDYNKNCNGTTNNTNTPPASQNRTTNPYQNLRPGGSTGPSQDPSYGNPNNN